LLAGSLASVPLALTSPLACAVRASGGSFVEFTERSEKSIRRGFDWLMKTYNRDGGCGVDIGTFSDISCSAVVGMAMLSDGNSPIDGPRNDMVRKTIRYLLAAVRDNSFRISLDTQVKADLCGYADHHFAALMLSQALGQDKEVQEIQAALVKLVEVIGNGQSRQGHWGDGRYPQLAAVTGWCSLRAAHFAGVKVNGSIDTTAQFLLKTMETSGRGPGNVFNTAAGIRVLYALEMEGHEIARRTFDEAIKTAKSYFPRFNQFGGEQYLAFQYINEAMLQTGGDDWQQWFPIVRDKLIDVQNADGSWLGHSCIVSRTFCTACSLLVLTSPNRYLPISQV
jgi:hypothetical protein